jgi:mono/diheme cytochrome c family protein
MKKILQVGALIILGGAVMLIWAGPAAAGEDGQKLFSVKCAACHGEKGDGKGPLAKTFDPKPGNFCDPKFWQGDVDKKITDSVIQVKNQMLPMKLKPDEIKAVIEYIKSSCKK